MKNEYGEVLEIQSDNDNVKKILHNLFYDILNIEFNLWRGFVICVSMVISFTLRCTRQIWCNKRNTTNTLYCFNIVGWW